MTIIRLAPYQAKKIIVDQIEKWGHRSVYAITPREFAIIKRAGGKVASYNKPNNDGSLRHEIDYLGKRCRAITADRLAS